MFQLTSYLWCKGLVADAILVGLRSLQVSLRRNNRRGRLHTVAAAACRRVRVSVRAAFILLVKAVDLAARLRGMTSTRSSTIHAKRHAYRASVW